MEILEGFRYQRVIDDVCELNWSALTQDDLIDAAWAYYYFSVQFRENLQAARTLYPDDLKLRQLEQEECGTDNLSPWPGVAGAGEKMNHDEFMARLLKLSPIAFEKQSILQGIGQSYLDDVREALPLEKALSIASYEDGGLERVFRAFLQAPYWDNPLLQAFRHFLTEHIRFDSDPEQGHGALSRHLTPDDRVLSLWSAFNRLLVQAVPHLSSAGRTA